jgi:hypothetical protein
MHLTLFEDTLSGGETLSLASDAVHRMIYVVHGGISIAGATFTDDQAWHGRRADIVAGATGATLWRYELASAKPAQNTREATHLKLSRPLDWPIADAVLMRGDSVAFPPGGCALLHTHQGPGIRCLIEGGIRIDTEGHSTSYGPGGAWFESGPAPVFAQAAADRPSRFVRMMILPATLLGKSSISYVNAEDREKPKSQKYKGYVDALIEG